MEQKLLEAIEKLTDEVKKLREDQGRNPFIMNLAHIQTAWLTKPDYRVVYMSDQPNTHGDTSHR